MTNIVEHISVPLPFNILLIDYNSKEKAKTDDNVE